MIKAIIIDDENRSRESLELILKSVAGDIMICGQAENLDEAIQLIDRFLPQLIFLDIELKNESGLTLLDYTNTKSIYTILTTAYDSYAIEALRKNANDYLLKPINRSDLRAALERARTKLKIAESAGNKGASGQIVLSTRDGLVVVKLDEIVRLEADGAYTWFVFTNGKKQLISKTIGDFEEQLSSSHFVRVHHSHIVNVYQIRQYNKGEGGSLTMINQDEVIVSRRKKKELLQHLEKKNS